MSRVSGTALQSYRLYASSSRHRFPTQPAVPVEPVTESVPSRAPGMRGKEEVERLLRMEAQYKFVGRHLDVSI